MIFAAEAQVVAVALWVIHTWAFEAAHATGYLAISSAERESGKSRLLEVLELLVRRPWYIVRPSEAVLFRTIEKKCPTILLDEYDTVFGRSSDYEGVRSVLNAGHRPGASVPRVVGEGKKMDVRDFPVYCPKALAGIRELPDTVRSRAIHIRLERRRRSEKVQKFRRRFVEPDAIALATRVEKWALENIETLNGATPQIPDELGDRAADCWEPLLGIADIAGPDWAQRARAAAVTVAGAATTDDTRGTLLLRHLRELFSDAERLPTEEILRRLVERQDGPWAEWWGAQVDRGETKGPASKLAWNLKPFGVAPQQLRVEDKRTARGYLRSDLEPVWERYLPPSPEKTEHGHFGPQKRASDQGCSDVPSVPISPGEQGTEHNGAHDRAVRLVEGAFNARRIDQ